MSEEKKINAGDLYKKVDTSEEIGGCRCTARRLREELTTSGNLIKVAVIGKLPTAERVVREAYGNIQIVNYERGTDFAFVPEKYDLVLVKSYDGEGFGIMGLTCSYLASGESVTVPVRLLDEPLCHSAEAELAVLVKHTISKKVNELNINKPKDLLDILWERIGCDYLSDLKYDPYRTQVPYFIKKDEIENFPLKDYEEMASYLFEDKRSFSNYDDVLQYLGLLKSN